MLLFNSETTKDTYQIVTHNLDKHQHIVAEIRTTMTNQLTGLYAQGWVGGVHVLQTARSQRQQRRCPSWLRPCPAGCAIGLHLYFSMLLSPI